MLTPSHIRAMRNELTKLATRSTRGEHEEMSRARFKQTMKDLPLVIGGSALGYGVGKTLGDALAEKTLKSPAGRARIQKFAPLAGTILSSAGAYALGQQRAIMRERRDEAEKRSASAPAPSSYIALDPHRAQSEDRAALAKDTEDKPVIRRSATVS